MPTLVPLPFAPGDVAPGQFGPIRCAPCARTMASAPTMSWTGIPSVMQKMTLMPASAASAIASPAPAAGTKMQLVLAPVSRTASITVSNIGTLSSSARSPPRPGVTPATILVPYAAICAAWKPPSRPVSPWTTRRVCGPTRMLMLHLLRRVPPPSPPPHQGWPQLQTHLR